MGLLDIVSQADTHKYVLESHDASLPISISISLRHPPSTLSRSIQTTTVPAPQASPSSPPYLSNPHISPPPDSHPGSETPAATSRRSGRPLSGSRYATSRTVPWLRAAHHAPRLAQSRFLRRCLLAWVPRSRHVVEIGVGCSLVRVLGRSHLLVVASCMGRRSFEVPVGGPVVGRVVARSWSLG